MAVETQKLKVFISWAGERANAIATGFNEYLLDVVNAVQPFMSSKNIDKGTRWSDVLNSSLQESSCAIVCLTQESVESVWVAFEAGAISRAGGGVDGATARIWTYLSGIEATDYSLTPFREYQATNSTKEETFRLIESINRLSPDPVPPESLKRRFERSFWPDFSAALERARTLPDPAPVAKTSDLEADMLAEILNTLRSLQRDIRRSPAHAFNARYFDEVGKATRLLYKLREKGLEARVEFDEIALGQGEFVVIVGDSRRRVPFSALDLLLNDEAKFARFSSVFSSPKVSSEVPQGEN